MEEKTTLQFKKYGLVVELDPREVFPEDPGKGTPVMVVWPAKKACTTFWCATGEGEIDGHELSDRQLVWLWHIEPKIDTWLTDMTRKGT